MTLARVLGPASAALALVAILACEDAKSPADDVKAGAAATDFTTRDVSGNNFRLSDHLGKETILIDFWATWCQPCLAEMPHLIKLFEANKSRGLLFVAISMDDAQSLADVPAFANRAGMTGFPVLLDEDSHIASIYNPRKSAPESVIIDKSGHIFAVREGYTPGDEAYVEKDVLKALDQGAPAK